MLVGSATLVIAVAVGCVPPTRGPGPLRPPSERAPGTGVLALGGSVLAVTAPAQASSSYAATAGRLLGRPINVVAEPGAGYLQGHAASPSFRELLGRQPTDAAVVLLADPDDDVRRGAGAADERLAAAQTLARIRADRPAATVVVMGPLPLPQLATALVSEVRLGLRAAASDYVVPYVDPVGEGWLDDADAALFTLDGLHLTSAGHAFVGLRLADALTALLDARGRSSMR